ncbi:MAG: PH domain-containing protein [Olsenella sp.]|nr:PH domain-containing protein [Olsenella sp.]
MANEMQANTTWTFMAECKVPKEVEAMLVPGERAEYAFKTVRDVAVFTNRRLIVRDAQGITGKKVEQYSLPWSAVNMWSSENAGHLDFDSEIELWTRAGHVKISLKRGADVRKIDNLIAAYVLG